MSESDMYLSLEISKFAVISLGYVGLPFAINTKRTEALQAGHDSTLEVSDDELAEVGDLQYSSSVSHLEGCNIYIVTVPTTISAPILRY